MLVGLIVVGAFVGFISGFFGVGGGTILVPILLYLGYDIKDAIGISVVQMVFSSIFGSYLNYKRGSLKLSSTIFVGFGGFLGALASGFIVHTLSSKTLTLILIMVVLFAIYKFFNAPVKEDGDEVDNRVLFFIIGIFIGMLATSVGIGGALLLTPILVGFLSFSVKKAVSASLFFVVFSSLSGLISLSMYGYVDYVHGLIIGISSLIGVFFGIKMAHKTNPKKHKKLILMLNFVILALLINKLF